MKLKTLAAITLVAATPTAVAEAATKNGLTPLAPGSSVSRGADPLFKVRATRVKDAPRVFLRVCPGSRKRDTRGLICQDAWLATFSRRSSRTWTTRAPDYSFPRWWLVRPRTYYWQAYRIYFRQGAADNFQEGPIRRLRVRG